jgi:hypothetical protein
VAVEKDDFPSYKPPILLGFPTFEASKQVAFKASEHGPLIGATLAARCGAEG